MHRREFLTLFAGAVFSSEQKRYPDPATELEVIRLTNPEHVSVLPRHGASRRGNFLIYASDRGGSLQAYRMDLKSGDARQLSEAERLDAASLTLLPDDRSFIYCDGDSLRLAQVGGRAREVGTAAERTGNLSVSEDGQYCAYSVSTQVVLTGLGPRSQATKLCDAQSVATLIRPKRTQVLYVREDGAPWLVNFNGQGSRPLKMDPLAKGQRTTLEWTPGGRSFVYLRGSEMREHTPDENADRALAKTSQFAGFGVNSDASVFVGASATKASPYVLLLLRVTRREFTLCEHHATDPAQVKPVFTPNNQSVLFQSDRHGKQAIYRMRVEKLVESADSDSPGLFQD